MKSIDLSQRAKFRLSGADRARYLNGQVSNDVGKASESQTISACVTTVKGRLQGLVWITVEAGGDAFLIDADPELREPLFARLAKYIIADDAKLEDVTDEFVLLHDLSDRGEGAASERLALPGRDRWYRKGELMAGADWLGPRAAEELRIAQGVPKWGAELSEETLPAEALLDHRSVDFHKGCYVGQEVISRVESVGRVNRQLVALQFAGGVPAAGWLLFDSEGKETGRVTSVAGTDGEGSVLGLGYLKRDTGCVSAGEPEKGLSCGAEIRNSAFTTQT